MSSSPPTRLAAIAAHRPPTGADAPAATSLGVPSGGPHDADAVWHLDDDTMVRIPAAATQAPAPQGAAGAIQPGRGASDPMTDPVAARLREQSDLRHRAAVRVSEAYSTAYGHPTSHAGFAPAQESGRRRWSVSPRLAAAAGVVVLSIAATLGWLALRDDAEPLPLAAFASAAPTAGPQRATGASPAEGSPTGAGASTGEQGGPAANTSGGAVAPGGTESAPGGAVVHVAGQVARPGLVTVPAGSRVADALQAAGGALDGADLSAVNLARPVVDGEQILVPLPGEAAPAAQASAGPSASTPRTGPVNLNTADAAAFDALPGIGPVLAERIVAWRSENGPFTSVEDLGEVSGIGPAVLDKIRDLVRV